MEQQNNSVEFIIETEKVCRICMKVNDDLYSIFDVGKIGIRTHKIKDILTESTSIEVNELFDNAQKHKQIATINLFQ